MNIIHERKRRLVVGPGATVASASSTWPDIKQSYCTVERAKCKDGKGKEIQEMIGRFWVTGDAKGGPAWPLRYSHGQPSAAQSVSSHGSRGC